MLVNNENGMSTIRSSIMFVWLLQRSRFYNDINIQHKTMFGFSVICPQFVIHTRFNHTYYAFSNK